MTFRRPIVVTELFVVPGFNYVEASGIDRWTQYRHVTRLLWEIGDEEFVQTINPVRTGVRREVDDIATQQITVTVMQTVSPESGGEVGSSRLGGKKAGDSFAMSQIQIIGHEA